MAPWGGFETADRALTLIAIRNERELQRFGQEVLRFDDPGDDPRFSSNNNRAANRDASAELILATSHSLSQDQCRQRLAAAKIAYGAVNSIQELGRHPALRRREVATELCETVSFSAAPILWLSEAATERLTAAPAIDQHGTDLRAELS